ncbi:MAG: bifunctional nuclease family protein [Prevotellaceae bacterium]|jgi:bifunctional DNase/RNase|nr:bifunctional nuclease family protein [Prevotellaceae bacterium]
MSSNKIRLNILGISYGENPTRGYVLVVGERQGERRIPIVIGAMEAQAIALQLERFVPPRPLTHDLFFQFSKAFGIEILEVNIVKLEGGVFYSELLCYNGEKEIVLESRTSDAIALALRFRCPVFTTEEIMEKAGVVLDDHVEIKYTPPKDGEEDKLLTNKTFDELKNLLLEAIDNEDYEKASQIRDEIKQREILGKTDISLSLPDV